MKKNFLLLFLMALLPLAGWAQGTLNGTTQYGADGLKYKILHVYKTEAAGKVNEVSVSQNVYATNGSASIVIPPTVAINVKGTDDDAVAIDQAITFKVVEIEANGFENVKTGGGANVTSIQIGANIATIGANAFDGCSNVTSITFDANTNNVTIADDAFKGTKVVSLDLTPLANMTTVNKWFGSTYTPGTANNETLTSVTFPAKLQTIVVNAFAGCQALETVTFPETGLAAGTNLTINAGVFQETAIVNLDLTEAKIATLEKLFEDNNVTLKTVKMSKHVTTLNTDALANCIQLNSVDFSKAVNLTTLNGGSLSNTVVAEYDFSNCYTLNAAGTAYNTFLNFTTGENPFVNGTTTTNKNLKTVILPYDEDLAYSPVTVIATAFANCEKLTTIEHLEVSKITTVDDLAFEADKSLAELSFPASLANVNGAPFTGCTALKKLTFDGSANVTIGNGSDLFGLAAGTVCPLEELYITVPATTPLTQTTATIDASALTNTGADSKLKKVEIAKAGIFAGTINNFALAEGEDAEVTFGNIAAGATFTGQITGPTGTKTTTLTIGDYAKTATQALIVNVISKATVGAVTDGSVLEFIGQAVEIDFKGAITFVGAPITPNAVLTTVNFNDVTIPAWVTGTAGIEKGAFDGTNAPLLTDVTWKPTDTNAKAAFAIDAFGAASVGAAAKVTLHTTTAVASLAAYNFLEANLYNVIFDADAAAVVAKTTTVYGTATSAYFYGKYTAPAGTSNVAIDKKDGDVVVYSAFVDTDNNIYMDPLALNDGKYIVAAGETVIIRAKAGSVEATDMTKPAGGKQAEVEIASVAAASYPSTMRYASGSTTPLNALKVTEKVYSSDYIGTTYVGKTLYAMKNPASVGYLDWGKVDVTSYLPKGAVFVECTESAAARLNVIWLDGNATGIDEILNKKATPAAQSSDMYTLQGVRISAPKKGQVYIMNGKKYLAK